MYVITGATGHTGHRIAETLLAAGKPVKALARNPEKLAALAEKGATVVVGDVNDLDFLTEQLRGATAAYLMLPPNFAVTDWTAYLENLGQTIAQAVAASGVKKVVLLSSQGAHRTEGVGPVSGTAKMELALRAIPNLDVLTLRPGYFMYNLYGSVDLIKHAGINGGVQKADQPLTVVHPNDIADVAAKRLLDLDFTGFSVQFIGGPAELTMREITSIVGNGIGKPDLAYVEFTSEAALAGMLQAGLPETIAKGYVELGEGMNNGFFQEGYDRSQAAIGSTTLASFVENELKHAF